MKALTLTQPWATLVAIGAKRIETRSWSTPYRGPLAIHAAKRPTSDAVGWLASTEEGCRIIQALDTAGYKCRNALEVAGYGFVLPLGKILCVTNLVTCEEIGDFDYTPEPERSYGDYTPGRWAWHLADVKALPEPIACRGMQGLWTVPPEIEARLK